MTGAEYHRTRYADRKARGLCPDCGSSAGDHVRCADCRQKARESASRYARSHRDDVAARQRSLYWRDPDKFRKRARQIRLEKKLRGECLDCPVTAADGSNYCAEHRDLRAAKRNGSHVQPTLRARCECGERIPSDSALCDRCARLDGDGRAAEIIAALRLSSDGMSLLELCEALDMDTGLKNGRRQMWRWVKDLLEQGRVRRYWRESTGMDEHAVFNGGGKAKNAIGCWAYALDGKTEREWRNAA